MKKCPEHKNAGIIQCGQLYCGDDACWRQIEALGSEYLEILKNNCPACGSTDMSHSGIVVFNERQVLMCNRCGCLKVDMK